MVCKVTSAALLLVLTASSLPAAEVVFQIVPWSPTEFFIYAYEADGPSDNAGIASYGLVLTGNITSIDHASPSAPFAIDGSSTGGPAGFTYLRSADGQSTLLASQDTITPTPNLIYGLGHTGSSFDDQGLTVLSTVETPEWQSEFLIAHGTYEGGVIGIDTGSNDTFSNVFVSDLSPNTKAAEVVAVYTTIETHYVFDSTVAPGETIFFEGNGGTQTLLTRNIGGLDGIVSVESAMVTGADAQHFDVPNFSPYDLLLDAADTPLEVAFLGATVPGTYNAELSLRTLGGEILASYPLRAVVVVPEPSALFVGIFALGALMVFHERARR